MIELVNVGISCKQHRANADNLIGPTAINITTTTNIPVVMVGTDTDLPPMLLALSHQELNTGIHMLCQRNPVAIYNIPEIQTLQAWLKPHLLAVHILTGCYIVSTPYMRRIKEVVAILKTDDHSYLKIFTKGASTHEEVARTWEVFLLKLYGVGQEANLDMYHFIMYNKLTNKSSLFTGIKLESLPPTSAASKYHAYRAYHTVQLWLGN